MAWRSKAPGITWANADKDVCRHMASVIHVMNEDTNGTNINQFLDTL